MQSCEHLWGMKGLSVAKVNVSVCRWCHKKPAGGDGWKDRFRHACGRVVAAAASETNQSDPMEKETPFASPPLAWLSPLSDWNLLRNFGWKVAERIAYKRMVRTFGEHSQV